MKKKLLVYSEFYPVPSGFGRQINDILPHLDKEYEIITIPLNFERYPFDQKPKYEILARVPNSTMTEAWVDELSAILNYPQWIPDCVLSVYDPRYIVKAFPCMKEHSDIGWVFWSCFEGEPVPAKWVDCLSNVDYFLLQSEFFKKALKKAIPYSTCQFDVLYPSLNTDLFKTISKDAKAQIRNQLKIPQDAKVVLSIGKNQVRKNWGTLIEAVAGIEDAYLVLITQDVINDPPYDVEAIARQSKLKNKVFIINRELENQDLNYYYNIADVYVCPSHYEGVGMPIMEAAACGCPVVVPDYGPMAEIAKLTGKYVLAKNPVLEYNNKGIKTAHIDPIELREAINYALDGKYDNSIIVPGDNPTESILEFTPQSRAERLIEVIDKVIEEKGKKRFDIRFESFV